MRKKALFACFVLVVGVLGALSVRTVEAAGSVVVTTTRLTVSKVQYSVVWTSDVSGAVSGNAFEVTKGELQQVEFAPGTGGTQPTDLYDVTLVSGNGNDLLRGSGANLSNTLTPGFTYSPRWFHRGGTLDLVVANAGNAKTGTVIFVMGVE